MQELLGHVKEVIDAEVLSTPPASFSQEQFKDQEWHDEAASLGWNKREIICYFCGENDCADAVANACERRLNKILCIG